MGAAIGPAARRARNALARGLAACGRVAPRSCVAVGTATRREGAAVPTTTYGPGALCCPRTARLLPWHLALMDQRCRQRPLPATWERGPARATPALPLPLAQTFAMNDRVVAEASGAPAASPHASHSAPEVGQIQGHRPASGRPVGQVCPDGRCERHPFGPPQMGGALARACDVRGGRATMADRAGPARCEDVPVPAHPLDRVHRRRLATQRLSSAGLRHGRRRGAAARLRAVAGRAAGRLVARHADARPARRTPTCSPSSRPAAGCAPTCCAPPGTCSPPRTCAGCSASPARASRAGWPGSTCGWGSPTRWSRPALGVLESLLAGPTPHTRADVRVAFDAAGLPTAVQHLAHLLIIAELRALICSGPPRGTEHTYVLADEVVPPGPTDDLRRRGRPPRADPTVHRRARPGIRARPGAVVDPDAGPDPQRPGRPHAGARAGRGRRARAVVRPAGAGTHHARARGLPAADLRRGLPDLPDTGFPRRAPDATRQRLLSEAGGGIVVVRGEDVGIWKRVASPRRCGSRCGADVPLGRDDLDAIAEAAQSFADFLERPLDLALG